MEHLDALIADDSLKAWEFCPEQGMMPMHFMVSAASAAAWGIRLGLFKVAEDAKHLVSAEQFAVLAFQERGSG